MASLIKVRIALPAFLLKRVAANRSRSNALSLCLRVSFIAKPLHTFARHAVGNIARLSFLVALLVVPVSLDLGEGGLVVKSSAVYASDNGKMNQGGENPASASDSFDPGSNSGFGGSLPGGDNATGGDNDVSGDNGVDGVVHDGPGSNPLSNPDNGSSDNPGNGGQTGNPDDDNTSNVSNPSSGGAEGENSEEGENYRGAIRPANLTEFLSSLRNGSSIVSAERTSNKIEIQYSDGWQEQIEDGIYTLEGPNNNVIIRRPATKRDYLRLNSAF